MFGANVRFVLLYKQYKISYTYSIWLLDTHTNILVNDENSERVYCPFSECNEEVCFLEMCGGFETKINVKRILSFTENVLVVRMNERVACVPKPIHFGSELCLCMLFFLLSIVHSASFDDVALLHRHLFKVQNPLNQGLPLCIIIHCSWRNLVCLYASIVVFYAALATQVKCFDCWPNSKSQTHTHTHVFVTLLLMLLLQLFAIKRGHLIKELLMYVEKKTFKLFKRMIPLCDIKYLVAFFFSHSHSFYVM